MGDNTPRPVEELAGAPAGSSPTTPTAQPKTVEERLTALEAKPPKDIWDKIAALSSLAGGVLVAAIGFYATQIYDKRSRDAEQLDRERGVIAQELQTVEKFFPHLASSSDVERQGAIEAINSLGNAKLAANMARTFGGPGARQALTNIAATSSGASKEFAEKALTDLYRELSGSVIKITASFASGTGTQTQGSAFLISKKGLALTALYIIAPAGTPGGAAAPKIGVTFASGESHNATVIATNSILDLALLQVEQVADARPIPFSLKASAGSSRICSRR
jgi:S1-C subfamily serine protease